MTEVRRSQNRSRPTRPKTSTTERTHQVKRGETPAQVAKDHKVSEAALRRANPQHFHPSGAPNKSLAGVELKIPEAPSAPAAVRAAVDQVRQAGARALQAGAGQGAANRTLSGDEQRGDLVRAARGLAADATVARPTGPAKTKAETVKVDSPTSLDDLSRKHDVNPAVLATANPSLKGGYANEGDKVSIPALDRRQDPAAAYHPQRWAAANALPGAGKGDGESGKVPTVQETAYANGQPIGDLETVKIQGSGGETERMEVGQLVKWADMKEAAAKDGVDLEVTDGFRTNQEQKDVLAQVGPFTGSSGAAQPGHSPHQNGVAVDVADTPGAKAWVAENGGRFGFERTNGEDWHFESPSTREGARPSDDEIRRALKVVGPGEGQKLGGGGPVEGDAAARRELDGPLAEGDTGPDVERLQRRLEEQGNSPGEIDGIYGPKTAAAVADLNSAHGIEGDKATKKTQAVLDPVAASYEAAKQDRTHEVKAGETVERIARDENVSIALLRQANPALDSQQRLSEGQKLFVPGVDLEKSPEAAYNPDHGDPTGSLGAPIPRAHNLGIDPSTWARGEGEVPPTNAGLERAKGKDRLRLQPLQEGDEGEKVGDLQSALESRGYEVGERGQYDGKTAKAVRQFHDDQGLEGGPVATVTTQRHLFAAAHLYGRDAVPETSSGRTSSGDVTVPPEPGAPFGRVDPSTPEGQAVFREAAKLAGVPESWASSPALASLVNHESGGIVGRPNYTYGGRANDASQWGAIHDELRNGNITAASSATGLGQLLSSNVEKYYPNGVAGIGDPVQEAAGMMSYVKERYGNPDVAWGNHSANPRRHQGVPVLYRSEGY